MMKEKSILLTVALVLGMVLAGCSKEDDNVLSEETTPTEFEYSDYRSSEGYYLYDYSGSNFVGSEKVGQRIQTVNLQRGKHHLIWVRGLDDAVRFDPEEKNVVCNFFGSVGDISFCEKDIEVTEYLLAPQSISCTNYVTASLYIEVTDASMSTVPIEWDGVEADGQVAIIGRLTGLPTVRSVSLTGKQYKTEGTEEIEVDIFNHWDDGPITTVRRAETLCPLNGIDNIQLKADIKNQLGQTIPTTTLPKISLRRGRTTYMRGPLFSGTTADWIVDMSEPW